MRCGERFYIRLGESVVPSGGRHVGRDDAGVDPPADCGDVDAEPIRDLASSDMHRLFVHARSFAR